jgi:ryanodine receptor 2
VPYRPKPIKTTDVMLNEDVHALTELLAKHNHDTWSLQRLKDGWKLGAKRDDAKKEHPCLISYEELPESEKEYDRNTAIQTLKAIIALCYRITKPRKHKGST